jgi:hypothetical protein
MVGRNRKATAGDSTAGQRVFQHTQAPHHCCARQAQFGHVSDRDATVFRHYERLSFCGEAGHVIDDGFFLTAIKTQGLLLLVCTARPDAI